MRNMLKKWITFITAGTMALGALSLAACGTGFTPPAGGPSAGDRVSSNGGFAVQKGEYIYFINGVETSSSDNTYGTPVKGALMRIGKADAEAKKNTAETVIPSLMVAADYNSGIYIFGGRIYYATPNNTKSTQGVVQSSYLDFKSSDLNGGDIKTYFNVSDSATTYRFVQTQENGPVYLVYVNSNELHSYNTETGTDTRLATNVTSPVFNTTEKDDPYFYYTMSVTSQIDVEDGAVERKYNQIYRVRADVTEETAPYKYEFNQKYLDDHDGEPPYVNLGTIVLDGIGSSSVSDPTQFTHDLKDGVTPSTPIGYSYTLQSYQNGGIYFTRSDIAQTGTVGESGWLYYLSGDKLTSSWNSVSGNDMSNLDVVAQSTTEASSSALFYRDGSGKHHYLYVSGSSLYRADVNGETGVADTTLVTRNASGAVLSYLDSESDPAYDYVYYTMTGGAGDEIYRVAYNGTEEDYKTLNYDEGKPFRPVQLLDIEHARSWYKFELIDGLVFFADAEALGSTSYNYISVLNLKQNGALMDNVALADRLDLYNKVVGTDGYLSDLSADSRSSLSAAIRYYFYTGEDELFYENIKEATDAGKKADYLYSEEDQAAFKAYVDGTASDISEFKDTRTRSAFVTVIGARSEDDEESVRDYWKGMLQSYTPEEEEESGLPVWAWVLIALAIAVVVAGAVVATVFLLRARKKEGVPKEEKMYVDTTDDRDVDVYATEPEAPAAPEEPAEEPAEPAEEAEETEEPEDRPEE